MDGIPVEHNIKYLSVMVVAVRIVCVGDGRLQGQVGFFLLLLLLPSSGETSGWNCFIQVHVQWVFLSLQMYPGPHSISGGFYISRWGLSTQN